jgi:hypothetical protein
MVNFIDIHHKPIFPLIGYEVRGFVFELTKDLAFHLNTLREINPHRKHLSGRIPPVPIHTFFKNFEKPTVFFQSFN